MTGGAKVGIGFGTGAGVIPGARVVVGALGLGLGARVKLGAGVGRLRHTGTRQQGSLGSVPRVQPEGRFWYTGHLQHKHSCRFQNVRSVGNAYYVITKSWHA